jgi:hypothetical protein
MSLAGDFFNNAFNFITGSQVKAETPSADVVYIDNRQPPKPTYPKGYSDYTTQIQNAQTLYKKQFGEDLDPAILPALLNAESAFGTNKKSYNPKIGQNAYLGGLTTVAGDEIKRRTGTPADFNSSQGALNAMALTWGFKQHKYNYDPKTDTQTLDATTTAKLKANPAQTYKGYWGGGDGSITPEQANKNFQDSYNIFKDLNNSQ